MLALLWPLTVIYSWWCLGSMLEQIDLIWIPCFIKRESWCLLQLPCHPERPAGGGLRCGLTRPQQLHSRGGQPWPIEVTSSLRGLWVPTPCASYHVLASSDSGNKSPIFLMNAFAVIVHLPVCRETLNKEVVAFHCSQEKGEQLKTRSSHVPWNERDSASGQFSMQVACSQDP